MDIPSPMKRNTYLGTPPANAAATTNTKVATIDILRIMGEYYSTSVNSPRLEQNQMSHYQHPTAVFRLNLA
jgi:hypothetical protein